jgi:hypothetical protein
MPAHVNQGLIRSNVSSIGVALCEDLADHCCLVYSELEGTTFITSQRCMVVSIDTYIAVARFPGQFFWGGLPAYTLVYARLL